MSSVKKNIQLLTEHAGKYDFYLCRQVQQIIVSLYTQSTITLYCLHYKCKCNVLKVGTSY